MHENPHYVRKLTGVKTSTIKRFHARWHSSVRPQSPTSQTCMRVLAGVSAAPVASRVKMKQQWSGFPTRGLAPLLAPSDKPPLIPVFRPQTVWDANAWSLVMTHSAQLSADLSDELQGTFQMIPAEQIKLHFYSAIHLHGEIIEASDSWRGPACRQNKPTLCRQQCAHRHS